MGNNRGKNNAAPAPEKTEEAKTAETTSTAPAAPVDANGDGHDDKTGQFVDGNEGRPTAEQHPAPAVTETAAPPPEETPEEPAAPAATVDGEVAVVVSLMKIDGQPAGRIFRPADADQLADLLRLGAVRLATEDEAALCAPAAPAAEASDFE